MDDYNDYGAGDLATGLGAAFGIFMVFMGIMLLFGIGVYIYSSIAYMKMYQKSGHPNPWGAWVPFYRDYLFFEHGGINGWYYIIAYAAVYALSGIGSIIMMAGPLGAIGSMGMDGGYNNAAGGAAVGAMIFGQIFSLLSYVPMIAIVVAQIFGIINMSRAFSRPGAGMIVLGILVPFVWIGILAWGKTSVWRPEMAIHGTRGLFFPRQGKTYLERQITARFGGAMPAHAQKQPKAQAPQQPAAYAQQPYPGQPQAHDQQYPAQPAQPQYPAQQQAPAYPAQPTQQPYPGQQAPAYPAQQYPAQPYPAQPQAPVYPPQAPQGQPQVQPYPPQDPAQQFQAPAQPQAPAFPQAPVQPQAPAFPQAPVQPFQQDPALQAPAAPAQPQAPVQPQAPAQPQAQPTIQPSAPQAPVDPADPAAGDKQ